MTKARKALRVVAGVLFYGISLLVYATIIQWCFPGGVVPYDCRGGVVFFGIPWMIFTMMLAEFHNEGSQGLRADLADTILCFIKDDDDSKGW